MKKNYLLVLIFLMLGGVTAWYLLSKNKGETSTLGWDRKFKVENPQEIHKIFIARRDGINTLLERQGDHWMMDGKHKVNPSSMENLLETVTKLELKYVPPAAAVDNIVKELGARGIKVEIYNKAGKKIKAYYVGGVTADARGTYMIMEGSEQPMVMGMPTLEGQIRTRYDLKGDAWRDKTVFGYQPEEIQAVTIEYPLQRNKSFKLKKSGNDYEVMPFYENTPPINRPVDKSSAEAFLHNFGSLVAENFENTYEKKDSVSQLIPFSIVSVTDEKGEERKAAFVPLEIVSTTTAQGRVEVVERYHTVMNTGDLMLTQHRVFQKIFWSYEAFFQKGPEKVKD